MSLLEKVLLSGGGTERETVLEGDVRLLLTSRGRRTAGSRAGTGVQRCHRGEPRKRAARGMDAHNRRSLHAVLRQDIHKWQREHETYLQKGSHHRIHTVHIYDSGCFALHVNHRGRNVAEIDKKSSGRVLVLPCRADHVRCNMS